MEHIRDETGLILLKEAESSWQIPQDATRLSVLVVGAGGGGAPGLGSWGGGGGAAGLVFVEDYLSKFKATPGDDIRIKIGLPSGEMNMNQARQGVPGEDSLFGEIVALGGGGGGRKSLEKHHATDGGSAGGGVTDESETPAKALQPEKSGPGIGFGHPGGAAARGSGGGGAGGHGTEPREGGGGSGLQGVPLTEYVDPTTGFVTSAFDPADPSHHQRLFRDIFGATFGEDGWFAGGGAHNSSHHEDEGGKGGGSKRDAAPHTGGGGGGSTHNFEGGVPGIGGSGVILVRCEKSDGTVEIIGWGRFQPMEFLLRTPEKLRDEGNYEETLELLANLPDLSLFTPSEQALLHRMYAQIYLGQGKESEAIERFATALGLESQ